MTDFELTLDERQDRILEILAEGVLALIERCNSFYREYVYLSIQDLPAGVVVKSEDILFVRTRKVETPTYA